MKQCDCHKIIIDGIKKQYPEYQNIVPPIELLSGRIYSNFTADKPSRGKMKQVDVPVLLSKCPFCGRKYKDEFSNKETDKEYQEYLNGVMDPRD